MEVKEKRRGNLGELEEDQRGGEALESRDPP